MAAEEKGPARRRSLLYVPASNPRALEKAASLDCDGVILDLEDAVAPGAKDSARAAAVQAVARGFGARKVAVRCNGLDTSWGRADLEALAAAGPDAVLAPKVSSAVEARAYDQALKAAPARTRLWAMIETAAGVLGLDAIAACAADTRLEAFVFGPNDLSAELRLKPAFAREALRPVLTSLALAARGHGLLLFGGAFPALEDAAGFEEACREEAGFGFDGKTLVHPSQIAAANRLFSPSPEEIAWARAVVDAFAAPEAAGKGAIRLEGRMLEPLHLREAERVLKLAAG